MADNEPHAVVRLLIKRMESHPEEFQRRSGAYYERWATHVEGLREYGSEADNAAITVKLRDIRLAEIHEQVMDELLNGPERRRKEEEAREHESQLMQTAALRNTYASQLGQYQNAAGAQGLVGNQGSFNAGLPVTKLEGTQGIVGKSPTVAILDEWSTI